MNADEILLIRDIRRMFGKLPLDSDRMEVQVMRGHVSLSGNIKSLRMYPDIVLKDEVNNLEERLRKDPRIKSLTVACRFIQAEKKSHEHEEEGAHAHKESADHAEEPAAGA